MEVHDWRTGEVVGVADNKLDLNLIFKRLVLDEGDTFMPIVYINTWRYIATRLNGIK